ncbi:MAG: sugar kinase [Candidatus Ranarchaeia archaeon]|jgi:2-dehydro-3-deoxygluconokinase
MPTKKSQTQNPTANKTYGGDRTIEVVTIGEGLLIFNPPNYQLIEHSTVFDAVVGGTEANVAIALENLGVETGWISKLPNNPLGRRLRNVIKGFDVDVSRVIWSPEGRTGLLFVELGAEPRPTKSWYDRSNSAASFMTPEEIDWNYVRRAKLLHLTGLTATLSPQCEKTVTRAIKEAHEARMLTSFDVNYRHLLCTTKKALSTIQKLIANISILIMTLQDAKQVFQLEGTPETIAKKLKKEFTPDVVVLTLGKEGSLAFSDKTYRGKAYPVKVVNRMGAGDAFDAGFIYGYLRKGKVQAGLEYGGAMAALKHTIPTNISIFSVEDVEQIMRERVDIIR